MASLEPPKVGQTRHRSGKKKPGRQAGLFPWADKTGPGLLPRDRPEPFFKRDGAHGPGPSTLYLLILILLFLVDDFVLGFDDIVFLFLLFFRSTAAGCF